MAGATLALDFPNRGESTRRLLDRMADVVMEAGGRLYPAKDATMSGERSAPAIRTGASSRRSAIPAIMSDFWRRVTAQAEAA